MPGGHSVTDQSTKPGVPAQSPPVDEAISKETTPASPRQSWWTSDGAEPVRRNIGLVGVLVVLVIIGIITRPELYGNASWVTDNVWTILQQASAIGVVTVGMTSPSAPSSRWPASGPPRSPPRATARPA